MAVGSQTIQNKVSNQFQMFLLKQFYQRTELFIQN